MHDIVGLTTDGTAYIDADANTDDWREYLYGAAVMQFTGLRDKNGKEIFEGDIIQDCDELINYEVLWEDETACFGGWNHDGWLGLSDLGHCEVIGNVYENPTAA